MHASDALSTTALRIRYIGALALLAVSCSSSDDDAPQGGSGGYAGMSVSSGGFSNNGGFSNGGAVSNGGTTSTGGASIGGGTFSTGGTPDIGAGGGPQSSGGFGGSGSGGSEAGGSVSSGGTGAGTGGGSATAGAPAACGQMPGAKKGKSTQSVSVGGVTRTFVYYAPQALDPNAATPLVIVPHGFTMSGEAMYNITQYHRIADREGFVVAYPDGAPGSPGPWNVGAGICGLGAAVNGTGNDQAFLDEIMKFVEADRCLDRKHMFVTGFSMGGYFSNEVACVRNDVAAVGPHSGGSHDLAACRGSKKPVIGFHFRDDSLITYNCGQEAAERWARRNGCSATNPEARAVKGGSCAYYRDCPDKAQVAFCSFEPAPGAFIAGHAWAGGAPDAFSLPSAESASELGWKFFKQYAW